MEVTERDAEKKALAGMNQQLDDGRRASGKEGTKGGAKLNVAASGVRADEK